MEEIPFLMKNVVENINIMNMKIPVENVLSIRWIENHCSINQLNARLMASRIMSLRTLCIHNMNIENRLDYLDIYIYKTV